MFENYYFDWLNKAPKLDYLQGSWQSEASSGPHYLYRAVNSLGELLYVGETHNPVQRIDSHSKTSDWFALANNIFIYDCASRTEALAIEKTCISLEKPTYNNRKRGDKKTSKEATSAVKQCLFCERTLDPSWSRSGQKYCDSSCRASFWYRKKYKKFYDERYQRQKKAWERSDNGKRAGVPIRVWISAFPEEWK